MNHPQQRARRDLLVPMLVSWHATLVLVLLVPWQYGAPFFFIVMGVSWELIRYLNENGPTVLRRSLLYWVFTAKLVFTLLFLAKFWIGY